MADWLKLIRSGSNAQLNQVTASSFKGNGNDITGVISSSYALTASYISSVPLPSNLVSGSDQLTGSYDLRYEKTGRNIVSSSAQISSDISGSFNSLSSSFVNRFNILELTSGSLNSYTGSNNTRLNLIESKTGSFATTGSNIFKSNQTISGSLTISGSIYMVSGSYSGSFIGNGSGLTNIVSSSYSLTSSYLNGIFSRAGTIADVANGVSTTGSYYVWRSPITCRVQSIYGKKSGTGTSQVNARKSGSAGYALHTGSNISLSTADQFFTANSVQNTDYSIGDSLEFIVTGSGATQVFIQVDFIRI